MPVVGGRIIEIAHDKGHITAVDLDTRRGIAVDVRFAHPRNKPSATLHESLGLAAVVTPSCIVLKVDARRQDAAVPRSWPHTTSPSARHRRERVS